MMNRSVPETKQEKASQVASIGDGEDIEGLSDPHVPAVPHTPPDGGFWAWVQVACAFSVFVCTWGMANVYGIFQTFYKSQTLANESQSNIAWIGSIQSGLLLLVSFAIGPLYDAGYARILLCVGSFLAVFGLMMASLARTYWQLFLSQGVTVGIGLGMIYVPGLSIIPIFFSKRRALAFGIASLGSTVGGIVFPPVFSSLIRSVGFGWTMRVLGFIVLALLVGVLMAARPKTTYSKLRKLVSISLLRDGPYMVFCTAFFFGFMGVYIPLVYVQQYALERCDTPSELASYMLPIVNAGSIGGRVIPNYLADRVGPINMHFPMAVCTVVVAFAWIAVSNTAGVVIFCVVFGFCSGTFISLANAICLSLADDLDLIGTRLGMLTGFCGLGLLVGNPIAGLILDRSGWVGLQIFTGSTIAVSTCLMMVVRSWKYGVYMRIKV